MRGREVLRLAGRRALVPHSQFGLGWAGVTVHHRCISFGPPQANKGWDWDMMKSWSRWLFGAGAPLSALDKQPPSAVPECEPDNQLAPAEQPPAALESYLDVQGGGLTEDEKDRIMELMNEMPEVSVEFVLKMVFVGVEAAKRVSKRQDVSDFMTTLTRTPRPHPVDRQRLHVKSAEEHVLPVYHYRSADFDPTKKYFTFLVLGETGVGKTTLLDAFANYLGDVHYADTWRWKLVDEDHMKEKHTSESQTTTISTYHLTDLTGKGQHIRIIDTPGFGDTRGVAEDARTMAKFKSLFQEEIDEVDYILLCVKAGETRWTPANKYVYDSILQMFGKDAEDRFILMCTFADAAKPKCLQTLKPHMNWSKDFPFNNSALYMPAAHGTSVTKFFWDMAMSSVRDFLDYVQIKNSVPLSLAQSTEVLQRRKYLQAGIVSAMKRVEDGFKELDSVQYVMKQIKEHEEQINKNGSFEYEEEEYYYRRVPTEGGKVFQLCSVCQVTCCQICVWPANATESQCTYLNHGRNCPVCPGKCPKSAHVRTREVVTKELRKVRKVWENKKKAFEDGKAGLSLAEGLLKDKEEKVRDIWRQVAKDIQSVKEDLAELDKIALKPRAFTDVDFFQKLIDDEKENKTPGFQGRVKDYEQLLNHAKFLQKVTTAENAQDMFPQYEEVIEQLINTKKGGSS